MNYLKKGRDIKHPKYVPAEFLKLTPYNQGGCKFFKGKNARPLSDGLIGWGDTTKTGISLLTCAIFQKMLSGEITSDYCVTNEDYFSWGINETTPWEDYNKKFLETLKMLPDCYKKVQDTKTSEERERALEEIYEDVLKSIQPKHRSPWADVKMFLGVNNMESDSFSVDISGLIEMFRKQKLQRLQGIEAPDIGKEEK